MARLLPDLRQLEQLSLELRAREQRGECGVNSVVGIECFKPINRIEYIIGIATGQTGDRAAYVRSLIAGH